MKYLGLGKVLDDGVFDGHILVQPHRNVLNVLLNVLETPTVLQSDVLGLTLLLLGFLQKVFILICHKLTNNY
jgi:hypothetical protein